MDPIYLLTGLLTVVAAIAGLVITCYIERRALKGPKSGKERSSHDGIGAKGQPG